MKKILLIPILLILSSCYTANKATKQVVKAQAYYPELVAGLFADWYPPLEFTRDSFIYIPGSTITIPSPVKYVDCDSIAKANKKAGGEEKAGKVPCDCPPSTKQVDTFWRVKEVQVANKAREKQLADQVEKLQIKNTSQSTTNRYLWIAVAILGIYTLGRWILRATTKINLP